MQALFWLSVAAVLYPYLGYPLVLWVVGIVARRGEPRAGGVVLPSVSMIVPVHNEEARIALKVANTAGLSFPAGRLEVLFVSDGSTDRTVELIRQGATAAMSVLELPERAGKAAALNAGLERATNEILVFSDASIELEGDALRQIVSRFSDPAVGCVSGEDRISDSGGEGLYGRYEVLLRRLESKVGSIVGASGSFYAQRRALCEPFVQGMAPDFLSVLRTVAKGSRAVSEPAAIGLMASVRDPKQEYGRKVRTLIRGMTTLFGNAQLLNPFRFGVFSFALFSHKIMRWLAPLFLVTALGSSGMLIRSPWYLAAFSAQVACCLLGVAAFGRVAGVDRTIAGRVALYVTSVNAAVLSAWFRYLMGVRQELWTPSRRP